MESTPYYRHFVIEIQCDFELGNSINWLKEKSELFLSHLGIRILNQMYHQFQPQGISLLYILATSHMAVHSWPENNYLHIDLITCSKSDNKKTVDFATKAAFHGFNYKLKEFSYNKNLRKGKTK